MILITLIILLFATSAYAADITVDWQLVDGADGYKIYQSTDLWATSTLNKTVEDGSISQTVVTVPDTVIILLRASAYNSSGESIRLDAGVFYWGNAPMPPAMPTGVGIE